ncbi:cobalamin biosynthesis protein [Mycolicibacterium flavescens]|uniref:Cobalamin biosynthesis protein CobD n=1 Tax=Mycolicibacterium flavescens TaxID=1776 RepID=A0A1E3RNT0_MYCFV|nr:cobalamin biosynthesis protein [Mycolicibacterium flavescens]MCV7281429.1 cobalamin biosynthesis protein [Mycolicibacterium flavescens]ODQ91072.1 cobalamin biosynthesis protein [Mycolicibacterium flavescens]
MPASLARARAVGIAAGYAADLLFGDPRRGHPVALFGSAAAALEHRTYADTRSAGVVHVGALLGALTALGVTADRAAARAGAVPAALTTAAAVFVALGGTSLARTGAQMAQHLDCGDIDAARQLLPSLCGRDPAVLDEHGLTRAALESIAENTSDAAVAPLLWAALGGTPAVLLYRGANTLDAMIGHKSPRYRLFGWAAARFDDLANYLAARLTGLLVAVCAPLVGGSAPAVLRAWRRDAGRHPSPNAGVAEAAFAGALGVRLGGPTQYAHQLEVRPALGDGPPPQVADLRRAVRLSRAVQVAAVVFSVAARSGRRASARW